MAFVLGSLIHGQQALIHRMSVVEVFPQTSQARVNGLIGIYSPNRATYQLQISPGLLVQPLPISTYGGTLQTDQQKLSTLQQPDGSTLIKDIKVNVGDIQPLVASGQVLAPSFKGDLSLKLSGSNAILDGSITNQSNLTLDRATLLTPGGIYELGTFSPGVLRNIHLSYSVDSMSIYNNGSNMPDYVNNYVSNYGSAADIKDKWISSLVGITYTSNDPQASKRYNLVSSLSERGRNNSMESNIYLGGWTETPPYKTELINQKSITDDMTLYLVKIDPQVSTQSNQVIFSPGLFTWRIFSNKVISATASPYAFASQQGTFTFAYRPIYSAHYQSVKSLFIHLHGKNTGFPIKFKVSLWNYPQQTWHDLNLASLGDFEVPAPQDFVNPEGEIRLQIDNPDSSAMNSDESVDFTLALNI
jgi:hypothetical protein